MTEAEWLGCTDPRLLLDHVRKLISPRKLRWFACACVRQVWPVLRDARSRGAVVAAERYADGEVTQAELALAEMEAFEVARVADLRSTVSDPTWAAARAAARAASLDAYSAASGTAFIAALCAAPWEFEPTGAVAHHGDPEKKGAARLVQCALLRDVVGNPFRVVYLDPGWLPANEGAVARLARDIYEEERWGDLPVLGDALEEAGCEVPEVLAHCRGPGPHTRGCWVVDLVRGVG